ncbi:hypothetical protein [Mesorhizobium sp. L-8-10]|uniref:hypothetical protein n=1 Tax=Mesorhizobium sp. L-8-10 TaxID=2744523 RepID=UPI00192967C5
MTIEQQQTRRQSPRPLRGNQLELGKMSANGVGEHRLLANQEFSRLVEHESRQPIELPI